MPEVQRKLVLFLAVVLLVQGVRAGYDPNHFDPENAANWYRKAFAAYQDPQGFELREYIKGDAALTPELERYLQSQQPVIELITKAAAIEHCDWQFDRFENIWRGMNDYSYELRNCAQIVLAETRYSEKELDISFTIDRCSVCFKAAECLNQPFSYDQVNSLLIKHLCLSYLHGCLNRNLNITHEDLTKIKMLLLKEDKRRHYSLNDIINADFDYAKKALKEHRDQRDGFEPIDQIIDFKGETGWQEFFDKNLSYTTEYYQQLILANNIPALRSWSINLIEQEDLAKANASFEKYPVDGFPDNFTPTQKIYDEFMNHCGCLFLSVSALPYSLTDRIIMGLNTDNSALLTGIMILETYRDKGRIPEAVPPDSPEDGFGHQPFELIKTDDGFMLKSQSMNPYTQEYPDYEFKLPKK